MPPDDAICTFEEILKESAIFAFIFTFCPHKEASCELRYASLIIGSLAPCANIMFFAQISPTVYATPSKSSLSAQISYLSIFSSIASIRAFGLIMPESFTRYAPSEKASFVKDSYGGVCKNS